MRRSKSTKKLVQAIKQTSGYGIPEIEDIYAHLIWHITQELLEKGEVHLSGIGMLSVKKPYKRKFWSAALQKEFETVYQPTVSIKSDRMLKNALLDQYEAQQIKEALEEE